MHYWRILGASLGKWSSYKQAGIIFYKNYHFSCTKKRRLSPAGNSERTNSQSKIGDVCLRPRFAFSSDYSLTKKQLFRTTGTYQRSSRLTLDNLNEHWQKTIMSVFSSILYLKSEQAERQIQKRTCERWLAGFSHRPADVHPKTSRRSLMFTNGHPTCLFHEDHRRRPEVELVNEELQRWTISHTLQMLPVREASEGESRQRVERHRGGS